MLLHHRKYQLPSETQAHSTLTNHIRVMLFVPKHIFFDLTVNLQLDAKGFVSKKTDKDSSCLLLKFT